jgi:general secretion pathway protein G
MPDFLSQPRLAPSPLPAVSRRRGGFTLLELGIALGIVGVLAALGGVSYSAYLERTRTRQAIFQIRTIEDMVMAYEIENEVYPANLVDVGAETMRDPWGNLYVYLRIVGLTGKSLVRKDKFLNPLNSDFDLYSKGPDGDTRTPLTAPQSQDDIVRANNGGFVGIAEQY